MMGAAVVQKMLDEGNYYEAVHKRGHNLVNAYRDTYGRLDKATEGNACNHDFDVEEMPAVETASPEDWSPPSPASRSGPRVGWRSTTRM